MSEGYSDRVPCPPEHVIAVLHPPRRVARLLTVRVGVGDQVQGRGNAGEGLVIGIEIPSVADPRGSVANVGMDRLRSSK